MTDDGATAKRPRAGPTRFAAEVWQCGTQATAYQSWQTRPMFFASQDDLESAVRALLAADAAGISDDRHNRWHRVAAT